MGKPLIGEVVVLPFPQTNLQAANGDRHSWCRTCLAMI
jgi:hypothetical protein